MTEIVIQGIGGRMGHVLCDMIAQREDCCVVAGIDMKDGEQNGIPVYDSLEKLNGKGDVIIDFSSPAAVEKALPYCQTHKLPIVVCTTGLSEELQLKVVQLSRSVPVFKSANMSMGINVLAELCKRASAVLGINYDISVMSQMSRIMDGLLRTDATLQTSLFGTGNSMEEVFESCSEMVKRPFSQMQKADRLTLVSILKEKGFFQMQRSVPYAAERLGVTKYTIYNYLNELGGV